MTVDELPHLWRVEKAKLPFPVAIVLQGSVVRRTVWGLTRSHAVWRGRKWVQANYLTYEAERIALDRLGVDGARSGVGRGRVEQ